MPPKAIKERRKEGGKHLIIWAALMSLGGEQALYFAPRVPQQYVRGLLWVSLSDTVQTLVQVPPSNLYLVYLPWWRVQFVICAEGVHLLHFMVFSESTGQRKQIVSKSPN